MQLTMGSVFSGIEGIGLGFLRTGCFRILWQIEKDEYCGRILRQRFPDTVHYADVRNCYGGTAEPREHCLAPVDVLTGGFPCQDISTSGRQEGIDEGKESGLWREQLRLIGELRPHYVLVENVAALRSTSKRKGDVRPAGLGRVLGDLAEIGYDAEWHCLPASRLGAPHHRDRLFLLAYPSSRASALEEHRDSRQVRQLSGTPQSALLRQTHGETCAEGSGTGSASVADTDTSGLAQWSQLRSNTGAHCAPVERSRDLRGVSTGQGRLPQSRLGGIAHELSYRLDELGREECWPSRPDQYSQIWEPERLTSERGRFHNERIMSLGNAVVAVEAQFFAEVILRYEELLGGV